MYMVIILNNVCRIHQKVEAVCTVDVNGVICAANDNFEPLFGWTKSELVGM